ncbi:WXG100 family type VII secretion target [Kitasatospora fiedleri]|uniref:WXG100 family type VII secretion target n=1 Tax=Kitasatospora fiedleri TaxID=2991545 RepID=UPI00249AF66C|nr:hypothetical protein [Kitasatospora fiedleri]
MTTDEPAWFTTPAHTLRRHPDDTAPAQFGLPEGVEHARIATVLPEGVEHARIGTVLPEGVIPAYTARMVPKAGIPEEFGDGTTPAYRVGGLATAGVPAEGAGTVDAVLKQGAGVPAGAVLTPRQQTAVPAARAGGTGNAGAGFRVDPGQYLAAVSPLLAASEQVAALSSALGGYLPSLEAQDPWGKDDSGKKFAEGEKGYLKYSHDTLAVLKELSGDLRNIADGLKSMGENYQDADAAITSGFGGQDQGGAPLPPPPSAPSNPVHVPMTPHLTQSGRH